MDQTNFINFTNDDDKGDELDIPTSDPPESSDVVLEDSNTSKDDKGEEVVKIGQVKLSLIKSLLQNIKANNDKLIDLLSIVGEDGSDADMAKIGRELSLPDQSDETSEETGANIIEGVFDGESMIGPDGKEYSVPANYASKSKLVEGDILKLTITSTGAFMYKQIGPIERKRIVGILEKAANGQFYVNFEDKKWKVLTASVTYYKGQAGDEAVIFIPKTDDSQWAAIDNIVRNHG